jgi:DNA-binding LytR/AlgR family response regulator
MKRPHQVYIIEDDPVQQLLLTDWMGYVSDVQFLGLAGSAKEGLSVLREGNVDILVLDIYLPDLTGLNLLKSLPRLPKVILQTNALQHAVEGFELGVVDYLVKPFSFDRFVKALDRAVAACSIPAAGVSQPVPELPGAHIFLKVGDETRRIAASSILCIEAMQNYSRIRLAGGEDIVALVSLGRLQEQLDGGRFVRCHRSFLVNIGLVESIGKEALKVGDRAVPLGSSYRMSLEAAWINARVISR